MPTLQANLPKGGREAREQGGRLLDLLERLPGSGVLFTWASNAFSSSALVGALTVVLEPCSTLTTGAGVLCSWVMTSQPTASRASSNPIKRILLFS